MAQHEVVAAEVARAKTIAGDNPTLVNYLANRLICPTDKQFRFLLSDERCKIVANDRAMGKTWIGCLDLLLRACPWKTYLALGPNWLMIHDIITPYLITFANKLGILKNTKRSNSTMTLHNGAHIMMYSAESLQNSRGCNISGVFIDEPMLFCDLHETWLSLMTTLREGGCRGWVTAAVNTCKTVADGDTDKDRLLLKTVDSLRKQMPEMFAETVEIWP